MCLFDGYDEKSTKDHEHKRRQTGKVSAAIVIYENANVNRDQPAFFSNEKSKPNFISLLTKQLQDIGRYVELSRGDTDSLTLCACIRSEWSDRHRCDRRHKRVNHVGLPLEKCYGTRIHQKGMHALNTRRNVHLHSFRVYLQVVK